MGQNAKSRAKITVKYDNGKINEVKKEIEDAHVKTGEDLLKDLVEKQYVPYESGGLQRSLKVDKSEVGQGKITVSADSPHAINVYYDPDVRISRKINKNARAHFFGPYIRGNDKEFFMNTFEKNYNKGKWERK